MPKISIIIPTYNESLHLPLLLSDLSISNEEAEIIIVDSNSEDKTKEIGKLYGSKIYISKKKNRGLQLNIGAKKAKGKWFIFIHADSRIRQGWLKKVEIEGFRPIWRHPRQNTAPAGLNIAQNSWMATQLVTKRCDLGWW